VQIVIGIGMIFASSRAIHSSESFTANGKLSPRARHLQVLAVASSRTAERCPILGRPPPTCTRSRNI
jgi:hypothetical protein